MQSGRVGIELWEFALVAALVERNTQTDVASELGTDDCGMCGGKQIRPQVFRSNGIRFGFFAILPLIVAADGHRERESDEQAEHRQARGLHDAEIVTFVGLERPPLP